MEGTYFTHSTLKNEHDSNVYSLFLFGLFVLILRLMKKKYNNVADLREKCIKAYENLKSNVHIANFLFK